MEEIVKNAAKTLKEKNIPYNEEHINDIVTILEPIGWKQVGKMFYRSFGFANTEMNDRQVIEELLKIHMRRYPDLKSTGELESMLRGHLYPQVKMRNEGNAKNLTRGSANAAGYDIFPKESCAVEPGEFKLIPTGVYLEPPSDIFWEICNRSSKMKSALIMHGVGDSDYRGEVKIAVHNITKQTFHVNREHALAQLVFRKSALPEIVPALELIDTARGTAGFGSTDIPIKLTDEDAAQEAENIADDAYLELAGEKGSNAVKKFAAECNDAANLKRGGGENEPGPSNVKFARKDRLDAEKY